MNGQLVIAFLIFLIYANPIDLYSQSMISLDEQFKSDVLADEALDAFENRAMQKLEDFYNFVEIIRGSTTDSVLNRQAKRLALNLFSNSDCSIIIPEKEITIIDYLESQRSEDFGKLNTSIFNVTVSDPLTLMDDVTFAGKLSFQLQGSKKGSVEQGKKSVFIMLRKVPKSFGKEEQLIWQVFLCDISLEP
ncbi:MAG: hypothetical protein IH946_02185 [Bacteroidetes bacterium]|nr:hypothetical protein [Bacteroidota bacterium]